eukprot:1778994-Alexandrium_andersonii.AAC.1
MNDACSNRRLSQRLLLAPLDLEGGKAPEPPFFKGAPRQHHDVGMARHARMGDFGVLRGVPPSLSMRAQPRPTCSTRRPRARRP